MKRKHVHVIRAFLTVALFATGACLTVQADELSIILPEADLSMEREADGCAAFSGDDLQYPQDAGEPALPCRTVTVLLPPDTVLESVVVSLVDVREEPVAGDLDVRPHEPPVIWDGKPVEIWPSGGKIIDGREQAVYGRDAAFPGSWLGESSIGSLNGYRLASIPVCLVRYNPVTRRLFRLAEADIRVQLRRDPSLWTDALARRSTADADATMWVSRNALNYAAMAAAYAPAAMAGPPAAPPSPPRYVIITTAAIYNDSRSTMDAFADTKRARGFDVDIKDEVGWGGTVGMAGDPAAERIRKWLQDNYRSQNIKYVLLIGNPDAAIGDIPMKRLMPEGASTAPIPGVDLGLPTDAYYADMTGDWDLDGDGYYGENADDFGPGGVDVGAELIVGRIHNYPDDLANGYDASAVLQSILTKTMIYDAAPADLIAWRKSVLIPIEPLFPVKGIWSFGQQLISSVCLPNGWRYHRLYDGTFEFDPEPEAIPCSYDTVLNAWTTRPFGAVFWHTHGSRFVAQDIMTNVLAAGLDPDHPSFVFQASCANAVPSEPNSITYAMLKKGAIATAASTTLQDATIMAQIGLEYAKLLFPGSRTGGQAIYDVKSRAGRFGLSINYFGDPSLSMFNGGSAPEQLTIAPTGASVPAAGGSGTIAVKAAAGESWSAVSSDTSWLTVAPAGGIGPGAVAYTVAAGVDGAGRTGEVTVGGEVFRVTQRTNFELVKTPGLDRGSRTNSSTWGDYDNDGDLDLLFPAKTGTNVVAQTYRNDGGGKFTNTGSSGSGAVYGIASWTDADRNGKLDMAYAGRVHSEDDSPALTRLALNNGQLMIHPVPGIYDGAIAWGDYDNDGDQDLVATGKTTRSLPDTDPIAMICRNDGLNGSGKVVLTDIGAGLPDLGSSAAAWGDFDCDGDLDLIVTGLTDDPSPVPMTGLYRNDGSGGGGSWLFTPMATTLPGVRSGAVAWGDFDNDGDLDLALTGRTGGARPVTIAEVYRNDGPLGISGWDFFDIGTTLMPVLDGSVAWGDYDNDGDLDLAVSGSGGPDAIQTAEIYRNAGAGGARTFECLNAHFIGTGTGAIAWGDYDSDGRLDLLIGGDSYHDMNTDNTARIYRNLSPVVNTAPTAPVGLTATAASRTVTLSWSAGGDAQTPDQGLSYNIRLGTGSPTAINGVSPLADPVTGMRRVAALGNVNENSTWTITNLPGGRYYWGVQSIDSSFAGSTFANGISFTIDPTISGTVTDTGGTPLAGVVMSGLPGSPVTDASGRYSAVVPFAWSGTVTPTLAGKLFRPSNRTYKNLFGDLAKQDFAVIPAALRAQYYNSSSAPSNNTIFINFRIFNDDTKNLDLKDFTIKYWYGNDMMPPPEVVDLDYAGTMPSGRYIKPNTQAKIETVLPEVSNRNRVVIVTFDSGAGSLQPIATVKDAYVDVNLRVHKKDFSIKYDQSNDYSYGDHAWYKDWPKAAVYYKGVIVWGVEP